MDKKLINLPIERILWLDLEMTGLSPVDDLILEVALLVTDWDFNEVATYHGVVKNEEGILNERLKANAVFWDVNPESKKGLLEQNQTGKSLTGIEDELLNFADQNFKVGVPVLLGGNSIHIDRQFIIKNWPKFNNRLHYRMLDVSAWKVVFENKYHYKYPKPDAHRALDDIRGSIAELRHYLARFK